MDQITELYARSFSLFIRSTHRLYEVSGDLPLLFVYKTKTIFIEWVDYLRDDCEANTEEQLTTVAGVTLARGGAELW